MKKSVVRTMIKRAKDITTGDHLLDKELRPESDPAWEWLPEEVDHIGWAQRGEQRNR